MLARRFFYVCAGLLCLALAFHFGQVAALAQVGATIEGASIESTQSPTFPRATACVNRFWTWMGENGILNPTSVPVPGSLRILATDPYGTVVLENGDWLRFDGASWVLIGNLVGGATGTQSGTLGQLKAPYRTPAAGR